MRQTSLVDQGTGHNPTKNHLLLVIRARLAAKNFQIESPRPLLICSLIILFVLLIKTLFSLLRITKNTQNGYRARSAMYQYLQLQAGKGYIHL